MRSPDVVSPELRQRINAAVEKLAYVPNLAASRLASARNHSVGVIVPTLYNVIFAEYLRALHEVFLASGFQVVMLNSRYSETEEEQAVRALLGQRVEGMIIVGVDHTPMTRRMLKHAKIPVVETFELTDNPIDINIGLSHAEAGREATQYLLDLGHRRVGFALGTIDVRAAARMAGYKKAMTQAGLDFEELIISSPQQSSITLGSMVLADLAARGHLPEALFCIDDNVALGASMKCRELGIKVPEHISILGFHDLEFAAYVSPPLSTVGTRRYDIGKLAAETVLSTLKKSRHEVAKNVDMGFKIIERGSTAPNPLRSK